MSGVVIPPAGTSAASLFTPVSYADPADPPVLLADDIDPATGELASLFTRIHPVDAMVVEAFRFERGSGAAVQNDGQRFLDIKKVGPSTARQMEDEARRVLQPLVDRQDVRIDTIKAEAGVEASDLGALFLEYTNLRNGRQSRFRIA